MPRWIPRLITVVVLVVVGLFAAYHMLRAVRTLLVLLAISFFLSIALEPGVNYLSRKGWRRGLATGVIFLGFVLVVGLFIGLMVPLVVDQVARFVDNVPGYVDRLADFADRFGIDFSSERLAEALASLQDDLASFAGDIAGGIFGVGAALLGTVMQILTVALFTFYMTADGPRLRRAVLSLLPAAHQREVLWITEVAIDRTGGYFYSRALLAGISTAAAWAAFSIIGIPYPLALALWLGIVSQFVPVLGTYIGGLLPLAVALIESPWEGLAVFGYVLVYQGIENYLLAPRITARTMEMHPAVAFGAAFAGGSLLGVPGVLMALPVAATIQAMIGAYMHRHEVVESPLTIDPKAAAEETPPEKDPGSDAPAPVGEAGAGGEEAG
ncbi:MAG TPA: AI-2E family transporter [Acidimicrobiia bacterium]|nr:AI-2E family transporter [Acidimicrobiia bacterium]